MCVLDVLCIVWRVHGVYTVCVASGVHGVCGVCVECGVCSQNMNGNLTWTKW